MATKNKIKTRSGAKKRCKMTGTGELKVKFANRRHIQEKKPLSMKLKARGTRQLNKKDKRAAMVMLGKK